MTVFLFPNSFDMLPLSKTPIRTSLRFVRYIPKTPLVRIYWIHSCKNYCWIKFPNKSTIRFSKRKKEHLYMWKWELPTTVSIWEGQRKMIPKEGIIQSYWEFINLKRSRLVNYFSTYKFEQTRHLIGTKLSRAIDHILYIYYPWFLDHKSLAQTEKQWIILDNKSWY